MTALAARGGTAPLAFGPLTGVAPSDLVHIAEWVAGAVLVTAILGVLCLRALARWSVGVHVALVAAVCVITSMVAIGEIAAIMLSPSDRQVMLELMGIAGLASLAVALFVGRSLSRASKRLFVAVRQGG